MRVLTLSQTDFEEHCMRLAGLAASSGPYDMILGIVTGGAVVAQTMTRHMPGTGVCTVSLQRPSTRRKGKAFRAIVRRLPRPVADMLRMAESTALRYLRRRDTPLPHVSVPPEASSARSILLVDDAVDSGLTMTAVVEGLRLANPRARITTAAITVTTPRPEFMPDYSIYSDMTLIRFPWSNDSKQ